jgi:dihydroorotase-like cyclic amidohydrolase
MSEEQMQEMGPVDYVVLEWPREQPKGDVVPMILDVADRGIIRILDIAFVTKDSAGEVAGLEMDALEGEAAKFTEFHGASTGLLDEEDLREAANALAPGTSAAVLVWENSWAAPIASALRQSGGQLVANGRIPVQAILASLEATEAVR